ncbi:hypothetical protein ACNAN0_08920 [Agrilactobacillus fermenti]|uniref:hypothetical protein n=1 Tax=Agrilactobacillus fermenti TaxID=2586909 RepID=UPI003A5C330A
MRHRKKMHTLEQNANVYYHWLPLSGLFATIAMIIMVRLVNGGIDVLGYLYCAMPLIVYTLMSIVYQLIHSKKH